MRDKILRGTAHLTVCAERRSANAGIPGRRERESPDSTEWTAASGTTYDGAVIIGPKQSAYAVLRGIDNSSPRATLDLAGSVIFRFNSAELTQPRRDTTRFCAASCWASELAARTGLKVGDVAEVIAARAGYSRQRTEAAGSRRRNLSLRAYSNTIQPGSICRSILLRHFRETLTPRRSSASR